MNRYDRLRPEDAFGEAATAIERAEASLDEAAERAILLATLVMVLLERERG